MQLNAHYNNFEQSSLLIFYSSSPHQYFAADVLAFPNSSDITKQYQQKLRNKTTKPLVNEAELPNCRTTPMQSKKK